MTNEIRVYLYTLKDDNTIEVQEGYFAQNPYYSRAKHGKFTLDNGKWCYVAKEPGEVYYRKIWLTTKNEELVRSLYVEYHERKIDDLERNLKMHKQAIAELKGKKK